jgi:hypothetical protein
MENFGATVLACVSRSSGTATRDRIAPTEVTNGTVVSTRSERPYSKLFIFLSELTNKLGK